MRAQVWGASENCDLTKLERQFVVFRNNQTETTDCLFSLAVILEHVPTRVKMNRLSQSSPLASTNIDSLLFPDRYLLIYSEFIQIQELSNKRNSHLPQVKLRLC